MLDIKINGKRVQVPEGATIMEAARAANVKIPSLCYNKDLPAWGSCGLCIVHLENSARMMRACCTKAANGMNIITHDPEIVQARRSVLELILSNHPKDCLTCSRNNKCELQSLAAEFGLREMHFEHYINEKPKDDSNGAIVFDRNKCISCGRCVEVCQHMQAVHAIEYQGRGGKTIIAPAAMALLRDSPCVHCGQCAAHCPVGAIYETPPKMDMWAKLSDPDTISVVQIAPSVRVALGEEFGLKPGDLTTGKIYTALRRIGFEYVFDSNFSADLTIAEEAQEFVTNFTDRTYTFPQFTSCCPAWVEFAEKYHHDLIPHLSSTKSPMQIMGAMIKTYWAEKMSIDPKKIFSVAVMPCTAKKYECERNGTMSASGYQDVDAVITTREFANYIRQAGIEFNALEEQKADSPLGPYSGAGTIFGATGGVMEAALRTAYFYITGKELTALDFYQVRGLTGIKEAKIDIEGTEVRVAVVNQLGNLPEFLEKIRQSIKAGEDPIYHFVEVMACRGGCVGGGGQPYGCTDEVRKLRAAGLYTDDERAVIRTSHNNPYIKQVYSEYLGKPNSEKAHRLLHTHYQSREPYHFNEP
ncbi:iron hydrogenase small subunit [Treponema sp. OMZ 803]|uniref:NADH-dependent [FeFe] hydrogenase, group A6 n=1 Tax=Treponema sp. OMZ 803 TaxID=120682 RepID=UPI0020A489FA|nr:NADH-dependent [FeFe] hydrogenase, group A6 [Treponema sp. OMZ 803]UTC52864.1 iron hydrogenase small subunit [Treponema sp. OMZ 803]